MEIRHYSGDMVQARPGMLVWVIDFPGSARGGYSDRISCFEADVFGDECARLRGGDLCGPNEVLAMWEAPQ